MYIHKFWYTGELEIRNATVFTFASYLYHDILIKTGAGSKTGFQLSSTSQTFIAIFQCHQLMMFIYLNFDDMEKLVLHMSSF